MIGIQCALKCEAESLIQHFRLKCISQKNFFPIYFNKTIFLIVSGIGKVPASAAVGYLYALTGESPFMAWLNVGVAGHKTEELGKGFLGASIHDRSTKKCFYPIFPWKLTSELKPIVTVDEVEKKYNDDALYDMESSGFWQAAARFSPLELIHCYKIVSDNLTAPPVKNPKWVLSLIEKNLSEISFVIETLLTLVQEIEKSDVAPDLSLFLEKWKFSETEKIYLKRVLQKWHACSKESIWKQDLLGLKSAREVLIYLDQKVERSA